MPESQCLRTTHLFVSLADKLVAPGSDATLRVLQDPEQRLPCPEELSLDHLFQRQGAWFEKNCRAQPAVRQA